MPKINMEINLKSDIDNIKERVTAKIDNNRIVYYEKNKTKVIYDYKNDILTRDNNDIKMIYKFNQKKETVGNILVKDLKRKINIKIKTKKLEKKDYNLEIEFIIEKQNFLYKITKI